MSDIPFWSGGSGGGTGGVSNYDKLSNKPVTNISGSGIVISSLSTGVYNIDGTWKITPDDDERETLKDDLFYIPSLPRRLMQTVLCRRLHWKRIMLLGRSRQVRRRLRRARFLAIVTVSTVL